MNKQQKEYLVGKLRSAAGAAKDQFAKGKTVSHPQADVVVALEAAGFTYINPYNNSAKYAGNWTLPLTKEMTDNKEAIEAFNAKVSKELDKAIDAVYLGSDDVALAILESFTATLRSL